ncbi:KN motif and ankyrin repeat domain-containing protein 2 [Hetaerina americana]|uniref:KN motif and ankyrin repeat domain-containing protein 2 n=1 Tax=Hetaerina americana TaxID=62018 RepID=UPI003A7F3234
MGVTSPNPGHHQNALPVSGGNGTAVSRLDENLGNENHSWSERSLCKCCPYGYHIDVDFVRFCEALSGSEGWGDTGKRIRRTRRRQRQSMEGLLGLTGPSVWLMEHHLTKIPQEWPSAAVVPDPIGASEMVRDALQQAVIDFEDTLKRSSNKSVPGEPSELAVDVSNCNQRDTSSLANSDHMASLQLSASLPPMPEEISQEDDCTKVLSTCTSDMSQLLHHSSYHSMCGPLHDSDGGSVGSNASAGLNTEALQNIREQMAISLEKMKEMEEKLKLIPILQVQLSILKEEKRKMLLQLKHKTSGGPPHEVRSLTNYGTQTSQLEVSNGKRDAGVCCSVLTRDVGTCHQQPRLRDVSTSASIPLEKPKKSLELSPIQTESIPSMQNKKNAVAMTELCATTWNFDKQYPEVKKEKEMEENISRKMKDVSTTTNGSLEPSLPDIGKSSFLKALDSPPMKPLLIIEKRDSVSQTDANNGAGIGNSKKELVKRDAQVQANLQRALIAVSQEVQTLKAKLAHGQTQTQGKVLRDMGILAKPSVREVMLFAKPVCKDFSSSCSFTSEKDSMSVSLLSLGVKSSEEVNGYLSHSKSTDTFDLVSSSDAAINVCILESLVSQDKTELSENVGILIDTVNEPIVMEKLISSSRGESPVPEEELTEALQSPKRKAPLLRQDTYTECQVNVTSLSSETAFSNENESRSSENLTDSSKFMMEMRRPSSGAGNDTYGETSYESIGKGEDSLHRSIQNEKYQYSLVSRPTIRQKASPSKEMKAASKVVNDLLQKQPRSNLKAQLKSATGIIQQEWFTISSTAMADPLDVEDYLDYFEDMSVALLEYVVNLPDNTGNTAMHYAVSHGNFDVVSILLDSKVCDIRRPNQAGYTCVMLVSLAEVRSETDRQVVRRLFQMADVNMRAKQHGQTALMLSVSHGRLDMVQLLLEAGADVNIQDEDGSTALMCAAEHGHADIVRALLAQPDCDASIEDNDGSTALNIAMEAGHRNIGVLLYAHEHFQPTSSPHGSLKQWKIAKHSSSQSSTPTPAETSS